MHSRRSALYIGLHSMAVAIHVANLLLENPVWAAFIVCILAIVLVLGYVLGPSENPSPFREKCHRNPEPLVLDHAARDRVLKQGFTQKKIPENLDAIVIGSGIGGLSTAAILAKSGKKVLVLEQHDQAGGCCHTFQSKGFEFDTGIHYVGDMGADSELRVLLDHLTDNQLNWCRLEDAFDVVHLNNATYPIYKGYDQYTQSLIKQFPGEEKNIRKYAQLVKSIGDGAWPFGVLKMLPLRISLILIRTRLIHMLSKMFTYSNQNLRELLTDLTNNKTLQAVLAYNFGDYGVLPSSSSVFTQATVLNHYIKDGAFYPLGGSSEIAFHLIPTIEKSGGRVLVRAAVNEILINSEGKANGVSVLKNGETVCIYAPHIISGAGIINTFQKLVPQPVVEKSSYYSHVRSLCAKPGTAILSVFVGLQGNKEELGISSANHFVFTSSSVDENSAEYLSLPGVKAAEVEPPLLFISFPSAKDDEWEIRNPGMSTCTIITLVNYEWFSKWSKERVMHRGEDYDELKNKFGENLWRQCLKHFPQLEDKVLHFDVGSPLSNQYYIGAPYGEAYGLDHSMERFGPAEMCARLRPETDIPGLFITGQDIFSCGFAGALFGGILASSAVLKRNVFIDLLKHKSKMATKTTRKISHKPSNSSDLNGVIKKVNKRQSVLGMLK